MESPIKITLVAGARPNFMKIAPIIKAIGRANGKVKSIEFKLVHTGQHYDDKLSKVFFEELEIPEPDVNLGVGSGSQAEQTAKIMMAFETYLEAHPCDLVIVVGDVNSTMACTIVAKKLGTKVAHVEGGIRSWDMSMPEEINRIVTDSLSDFFFTTSLVAGQNLIRSGISEGQIFFVGNTMIDSLLANLSRVKKPAVFDQAKLVEKSYCVMTLHRPSNVDEPKRFRELIGAIDSASNVPVVFPVHPRTKKNMDSMQGRCERIIPVDPVSYLEFIYLIKNAKGVITDSGGVQEETTVLEVPCLTLRKNTERPETVTEGSNVLIGEDIDSLRKHMNHLMTSPWKEGKIPQLWDGRAAERIVDIIRKLNL